MKKLLLLSLLVAPAAFGQIGTPVPLNAAPGYTIGSASYWHAGSALSTSVFRQVSSLPVTCSALEQVQLTTSGFLYLCDPNNANSWLALGLTDPGSNGIVYRNLAGTTRVATIADVYALGPIIATTTAPSFTASGSITQYTLVQPTAAANTFAAATTGYSGIAQQGVTNSQSFNVARTGYSLCVFDGTATIGNIAIPSTGTPTECHDSGVAASSSIPITTQVIGLITSTGGGTGQTAGVALHGIAWGQQFGAAAKLGISGNGTTVCSTTGTLTANNLVKFDASGNCVDSGAPAGAATSIATSGTPTSVDGQIRYDATNKSIRSQIDGIADQTIPSVDALSFPVGSTVCASGSDHTVQVRTVTAVSTASNAVLTITGGSYFYAAGRSVLLYGFGDAGYNGTYTVVGNPTSPSTTMTISLNSGSLTFTGAGTPTVSIPCNNSSDAAPQGSPQYLTLYTAPANSFAVSGKKLRLDFVLSAFASTTQTGNAYVEYVKAGSTAVFTSGNEGNIGGAANTSVGYFDFISLASAGSTAPVLVAGLPPTPPSAAGSTFFPVQNLLQSVTPLATNGSLALQYGVGWFKTGAGGTIAYSSGGSASGTGYCLGTAAGTQNAGTGAVWYFPVASGVIGSPTYANGPQANTGSGYTAAPTSWTMTVPTVNTQYSFTPASTCSGTVLTTGAGSLVGAMGNAQQIIAVTPTWSGN